MKKSASYLKETFAKLNDAWDAGLEDVMTRLAKAYDKLRGKKRAKVPVPLRKQPEKQSHEDDYPF